MNVHDTEWAYYAVPLMVLALSIHNEKERKIVMRKVMKPGAGCRDRAHSRLSVCGILSAFACQIDMEGRSMERDG